jgi:hypothetical protein
MRGIFKAGLFATACAFALLPGAADAQRKCPEGMTAGGECVNPSLGEAMRQSAVIFSQPRISDTAFPVLPLDDRTFRYPNQLIPYPSQPSPTGQPLAPPPPSHSIN